MLFDRSNTILYILQDRIPIYGPSQLQGRCSGVLSRASSRSSIDITHVRQSAKHINPFMNSLSSFIEPFFCINSCGVSNEFSLQSCLKFQQVCSIVTGAIVKSATIKL